VTAVPLLVFDTNILMEILLDRDRREARNLLELAEDKKSEIVVPEYVLFEFRGVASRWFRAEKEKLVLMRRAINEWSRSQEIEQPVKRLKAAVADIEEEMKRLEAGVAPLIQRIRAVARVVPHTVDLHFRGDLRFLEGVPPERRGDGLEDCRIYEALLEIARSEPHVQRAKYLVTRDADFQVKELLEELAGLGFKISKDPSELYEQLRSA
jgi:predicted nucleic acid-binding protein